MYRGQIKESVALLVYIFIILGLLQNKWAPSELSEGMVHSIIYSTIALFYCVPLSLLQVWIHIT